MVEENVSKYKVSVSEKDEYIFVDVKVGGNGIITNDELLTRGLREVS